MTMTKRRNVELRENRKNKRQMGVVMELADFLEEISDTLALICDHMDVISDYCHYEQIMHK